MLSVKKAVLADLPRLLEIFASARQFMVQHGNPNQWINGYPSAELLRDQIEKGYCQVCISADGRLVGTFCYIEGEDPNYGRIENGQWLNDLPYATIHRLASSGEVRGVADICFRWCSERSHNLRVDTHRDNLVLQYILRKYHFTYCGIIYVANGTSRLTFQRCLFNE